MTATKSSYVEGRLAKLEARLAETQAELIALKSLELKNNNSGRHNHHAGGLTPTKAAGNKTNSAAEDEDDIVAMAVHLGLNVSSSKEMSAQQRWLVRRLNPRRICSDEAFFFETRHVAVMSEWNEKLLPPPPQLSHTLTNLPSPFPAVCFPSVCACVCLFFSLSFRRTG